jgi:hypothetical protein
MTPELPDRSGMAAYVHLQRAIGDPERSPREARGKGNATAWRQRFANGTVPAWRDAILEHMRDGKARTFNRIAVELADATADVVFGKAPDVALWMLVADGLLGFTPHAPVFFRLVLERPPAKVAIARRDAAWQCYGCTTTAAVVEGRVCPTCGASTRWIPNAAKPWQNKTWIEVGERVVLLAWGGTARELGDVVLEVCPNREPPGSGSALRIGARGVVVEPPRFGSAPSRCPDHDDSGTCTCGGSTNGSIPGTAHVAGVVWELDDGSSFRRALHPAGEGIGWMRVEHDGWVALARAGAR